MAGYCTTPFFIEDFVSSETQLADFSMLSALILAILAKRFCDPCMVGCVVCLILLFTYIRVHSRRLVLEIRFCLAYRD